MPDVKREKKLTKKERKALAPARPGARPAQGQHIHCIACGRHLDQAEFNAPVSAVMLRCQHGSTFPSCVECTARSKELIAAHDRDRQPVRMAEAWH